MQNYHILLVRFIALTDKHMYPRIRIKSELHKQSITVAFDSKLDVLQAAETYLNSLGGFPIIGKSELKDDYVLIVDAVEGSFTKLK